MNESASRHALFGAAFVVLLCLSAWGLNLFARWQFTAELSNQAASALALAATGETPYRWNLSDEDDVIAQHPFGADKYAFADNGMTIHAGEQPFEVGLRLERAVDLQHFPRLHIAFDAKTGGQMQVVVREQLDSPEYLSSAIAFTAGHSSLVLDLSALPWHGVVQETDSAFSPGSAAMLRLRISLAQGNDIALASAALARSPGFRTIDISRLPQVIDPNVRCAANVPFIYRLPFNSETQKVDIAHIVANRCSESPTLVLLPQHGRVEQEMALRNAVYSALPAAILIPEGALETTFAKARNLVAAGPQELSPRRLPWGVVVSYAMVLLIAGFKPPRSTRARAMLEIALVLAGPLWLILGGNYDGSLHAAQIVLIALTLAYAVSLSRPRAWRWNGELRAWSLAAAVVMVAFGLGIALHDPDHGIASVGLKPTMRYFVWALVQQYLICAVCTERWHLLTRNSFLAIYLGALGFALLHTPNAALMLATFAGGLCWCAIYLRYRALLPLAFSHAGCALLLAALLPADILHSAEVSARFFQ